MTKKRCVACGMSFIARPQVPHQTYCSASRCQHERRQEWQRSKLKIDADHRDNKSRAQQTWAQKNPNYWRQYRDSHPDYVENNRSKQRGRNTNSKSERAKIAKKDASIEKSMLPYGLYELRFVGSDSIAKTDVWLIEIIAHTCPSSQPVAIAKIGRDQKPVA